MNTTRDLNGKLVKEGDRVEVLSIDPTLLATIDPEEKSRLLSMIGDVFIVEEVNEYGYAMVEKWWRLGPDTSVSHSVALNQQEMRLVKD